MNKDELEIARELVKIQGSNGNWDWDGYMHGMYNGMELILSIFEDRSPVFKEAPDQWLKDSPDIEPVKSESEQ